MRISLLNHRTWKMFFLASLFLILPSFACAWGVLGHRIVGEIADHYLSSKAKKAVKQLLGHETMAMSANWADFIKSDTSYNYLNTWHYVNLPQDLNYQGVTAFLSQTTEANIYTKTNEMIAVLKRPSATYEERKMALRLLIHLMGDMHQPMHTARKEDLGGNRVYLTWFGEKSNLHRVWDEQLIDFQQLSYTEYTKAINHASPVQLAQWRSGDIRQYIYESYEICNKIYATGIKNEDKLSYRYNFDWIETVNSQLLKGGVRLAHVLNEIYK